jgi:pilus assembly protein CpaF
MCSIHANHARDALAKLCTLPLLAGRNIDSSFVVPTVASAIDVVVHAELERGGRRRVVEIVAPTGRVVEGIPESTTLFALSGGTLTATGELPARAAKFRRAGLDPAVILRGPVRSNS